jgi:Cd2+/Zn2+-exporting ATPase
MTKKIKLEGLHCADCAYEIEDALKKEGFKIAIINFATKEAIIEGDLDKAKEIIRRVSPEVKIVEDDHLHHHDEEMEWKQVVAILISLGLFAVGLILYYYYGLRDLFTFSVFTLSYLIVGWRVLKNALINSIHGKVFDENFLISVATIGAFLINEYPEGVAVMLFYIIGEFFQERAISRSRRSIRSLLELKAEYANLKVDGRVRKVKPEDLKVGDIIVVKPGERVPVDGVIIDGRSNVDTSALTGESIPKVFDVGDEILSGMVNLSSTLTIKVSKRLEESTVSRILELVETASARKAKTEMFFTRFARIYTPIVVTLSILIAVVPPLLFGEPFHQWLYRALVLLVISCPCALVISIPLGYFGGIGRLAREGILVKGSKFIDILTNLRIVAFDKTGTLTKGLFRVRKIVPKNGFSEDDVLRYAALAEAHSNHPIAYIIKEAYGEDISGVDVEEFTEIPGMGVKARVDGKLLFVGNDRLLHHFNIPHDTCDVKETVVHVVVDGIYAGYIIISDEIKEDASRAVSELKRLGVKNIIMVTGDNRSVAETIAEKIGIDEVYSELIPEEKIEVVSRYKGDGEVGIAFVGDGINDAPVIAEADVGIAMGALGSDAAIETADIVIMDDKPSRVPIGIRIARKTKMIIYQNITLALVVKVIFISLGIIGQATMWEAVFADVGVALIALFNAMRILR